MSADNWTFCPKCLKREEARKDELKLKAESEYGKMPKAEYLELLKESEEPLKAKETLREDYEFFMSPDGYFKANYKCHCDVCGFKHTFKHEKEIKI